MEVDGGIKRLWPSTSPVNVNIFTFLGASSHRKVKQNAQISTLVCKVAINNKAHIYIYKYTYKALCSMRSSPLFSVMHIWQLPDSFIMPVKCSIHRACL